MTKQEKTDKEMLQIDNRAESAAFITGTTISDGDPGTNKSFAKPEQSQILFNDHNSRYALITSAIFSSACQPHLLEVFPD